MCPDYYAWWPPWASGPGLCKRSRLSKAWNTSQWAVFLHQFCLQVLSRTSLHNGLLVLRWNKSSPLQGAFGQCFITESKNKLGQSLKWGRKVAEFKLVWTAQRVQDSWARKRPSLKETRKTMTPLLSVQKVNKQYIYSTFVLVVLEQYQWLMKSLTLWNYQWRTYSVSHRSLKNLVAESSCKIFVSPPPLSIRIIFQLWVQGQVAHFLF